MVKIKPEMDLLPWVHNSKKRSNGMAPLYIRITINGIPKEVSLKKNVFYANWDIENKKVSKSEANFKSINQAIDDGKVDLKRIFDTLCLQHETISSEMVKRVFDKKPATEEIELTNINEELTLIGVFDDFIIKLEKLVDKKKRSAGTLRQMRSTRNKVIEFLQFKYRKTDFNIKDVQPMFADYFYDYLTLEVPNPLAEVTAKKHIKKTKQMVKIAVRMQIVKYNPIVDFDCGGGEKEVIPLEFDEVQTILNKDFGIDRLNEVRDAFIFQCFTGFAYQDLYDLTPENFIYVGPEKEKWLAKERGKTDVYEIVPVLPIIENLIGKYKNHPKCITRNALMPINSNKNYNAYLKEIAVICQIKKELKTHLARHTFADIMLNLGMPLEDVSKMLGHKSIKTTQRYCRVRKERISKNFNSFIRNRLTIDDLKLAG